MGRIKKRIRHKIIKIALENNINNLKYYLNTNNINIQKLNNKFTDILLKLIENNASFEVIKFIKEYGNYKNLDFTVCESSVSLMKTPLSVVLDNNNFKVAEYLMENGASIFNIPYKTINDILNKNNLIYLLTNGLMTSELVYYLIAKINISKNKFLDNILRYYIYDNKFILNLLSIRSQNLCLTDQSLKNLLNKEKSKILINYETYLSAVNNKNYDIIDILYTYDTREENIIIQDICNIQNPDFKKYLLSRMEMGNLKFQSTELIKDLLNFKIELKKKWIFHNYQKLIKEMINENDDKNLKKIFSNNMRNPFISYTEKEIDNELNDLLSICNRNKFSPTFTKYFIEQYHYEIFKYLKDFNKTPNSLIYELVLNNKFDILDIIMKKGVNLDPRLIQCLYYKRNLNEKNLKYILDNSSELAVNLSLFIKDNKNYFLKYILKSLFNKRFILSFLMIYKYKFSLSNQQLKEKIHKEKSKVTIDSSLYHFSINNDNYQALELLYIYDERKEDIKHHELFKIFEMHDKKNHHGRGIALLNEIKNNNLKIKINTDEFKYDLFNIEKKREIIREKILKNDIQGLKHYIIDKKINFLNINNEYFDVLIYAIQNNTSVDMINYLVIHYSSLNYFIYDKGFVSPLSCALSNNNIRIAKLLLNFKNCSINHTINNNDIIYNLFISGSLNSKNLNFILNNGYKLVPKTLKLLIVNNNSKFLKIIFDHHIYDTSFILKLLYSYKNKTALSSKRLNEDICNEKSKIKIEYDFLYSSYNNEALDIIFNHLQDNHDSFIFENYDNIYSLIYSAFDKHNYYFIEKFIGLPLFDITELKIETCIQTPFINHHNIKAVFSFLKTLLTNKLYNIKYINFEQIMKNLETLGDHDLIYYFVETYLNHETFQITHLNFEKMFIIINKFYDKELMSLFLINTLSKKNFNVHKVNIENVLRILIRYSNSELPEVFMEKLLHHNSFDFSKINFEKYLFITLRYKKNSLLKLIIEESYKNKTFNISKINMKKCLSHLIEECHNIQIIKYFIKKMVNSHQWKINYYNIKEIIIPIWNKKELTLLEYFIEILLVDKCSNDNEKNSIKEIISIFNKIDSIKLFNYVIKIMLNKVDQNLLTKYINELQKENIIQCTYKIDIKINI